MTTSGNADGASSITERQNEDGILALRAAARTAYDRANRIRALRTFATVAFAIAAPFLTLVWPAGSSALAVIAAVWLLAGRTVVTSWYQQQDLRGVQAQELFDTILFHLPWNESLAGLRSSTVEETAAARPTQPDREREWLDREREWYENVPTAPWPLDVLACQVQNAVYSRRNHRVYARVLRTLVVVVPVAALAFAWVQNMSVGEFMTRLFVPLLPALLDLVEMPREHEAATRTYEELEQAIQVLWDQRTAGHEISDTDCRAIQDRHYTVRKAAPPVPSWLNNRLRDSTSRANEARMNEIRDQLDGT